MKREKINMEYIFKASPAMLYQFMTTPSCLVRWFCDGVDISGTTYVFEWDGSEEVAELVEDDEEERLRFRWEEADEDDEFFEYRFYRSPVTGETIMEITDFCDEDEVDDTQQLWNSQITRLRQEIGG